MDAFRIVAVNVTSVVTTTGFALGDYSMWGHFSIMLFFYLGFIGGCSGSTAGGIKIFRFQVAYTLLKANLYQLIHPRAVLKQNYNGHRLDEEIVRSILTFSFFFAIVVCLLALGLSLIGLDWMTALTGAASTVAGVGPGWGPSSALGQLRQPAGRRQVAAGRRHAARSPGDHHRAGPADPGVLAPLSAHGPVCNGSTQGLKSRCKLLHHDDTAATRPREPG